MAALQSVRSAQRLMMAEAIINIATGDTLKTSVGNTISGAVADAYGKAPGFVVVPQAVGLFQAGVTQVYDLINLPLNAVVMGGEVYVQTAFVGPTAATLSLGDAGDSVNAALATRYANAINLLATGRTALTPTGITLFAGQNLRASFNLTVANATAGLVTVRLFYAISGKADDAISY